MAYDEYKQKLDSVLHYIKTGSAVNTRTLSQKLQVSKSTILRMVATLRLQGEGIKYCEKKKEYFVEK